MRRETILNKLPIGKDDFVVEIGSGHLPFKHTKLIFDKYPFDNVERFGDIKNIAPIIKADAIKIPLKNKSCDLLFASHVIEHISKPDQFINEAKRCSRYIYLEFPSLKRELMYAWSFHKWLVEIVNGKLIFFRNDVPQIFNNFFHKSYDLNFHIWSEERFEELNNHVFLETDELTYEFSQKTAFEYILDCSATGDDKINFADIDKKKYSYRELLSLIVYNAIPEKLIKIKKEFFNRLNSKKMCSFTTEILEKLICQKCKTEKLTLLRDELVCDSCKTKYKKTNEIFDFDI